MKTKMSMGLRVTAIFFILLGVWLVPNFFSYNQAYWNEEGRKSFDNAIKQTIDGLAVLKAEKEQKKLRASGRLEEFNEEYDKVVAQLTKLYEEFDAETPGKYKVLDLAGSCAAILALISGVGLLKRQAWARKTAILGLCGLGVWDMLIWWVIYPPLYIAQCTIDAGNKLNLMIDPAYNHMSAQAGRPAGLLLFGLPTVLGHIFVLALIAGVSFYLTRPGVIAQLRDSAGSNSAGDEEEEYASPHPG